MAETDKEKTYFKTSELIEKSGLTRQIIYEYINMGLLIGADRTPAGHRLFDQSDVTQAKLIHQLSESGYTLRAIREIFIEGKARQHNQDKAGPAENEH